MDTTEAVNSDVSLEEKAAQSVKMSDMVRVQRWDGPMGPVVGPRIIVLSATRAAEALAISGFARPWIVEKIREHLLSGGTFINKCSSIKDDELAIVPNGESLSMQVRSEYRLATHDELIDYVDLEKLANVTGKKITARSQERKFRLLYHEGPELIDAYYKLPRQARVILDLLNEAARETYTEAGIYLILSEHLEELKTRQDPERIYGFYKKRLTDEGHLVPIE
jgi:hypothetical protein